MFLFDHMSLSYAWYWNFERTLCLAWIDKSVSYVCAREKERERDRETVVVHYVLIFLLDGHWAVFGNSRTSDALCYIH